MSTTHEKTVFIMQQYLTHTTTFVVHEGFPWSGGHGVVHTKHNNGNHHTPKCSLFVKQDGAFKTGAHH